MSNTKQTSVEYLVREVRLIYTTTTKMPDLYDKIKLVIEQAKQMEKEQITNAFIEGHENGTNNVLSNANHYYTQTYENTNN